jgi:UDPglucose--hexose-1-phosphate uridylyltransferase
MPELRRNPLTDVWVVVAPERKYRPSDQDCRKHSESALCPFCPGNEGLTPPAILTLQDHSGGPWALRVIPNRYPALRIEESAPSAAPAFFDARPGIGAHEVIVDSSGHELPTERAGFEELHERSLRAAQTRMQDLRGDTRLEYHMYFRNTGPEAGSTLHHPHAQLLALPLVPPAMLQQLQREEAHRARTGTSMLSSMLESERASSTRIVIDEGGTIAFCPWASEVPFEVWIADDLGDTPFVHASVETVARVGRQLGAVMWALERSLPGTGSHVVLHVRPAHHLGRPWHWHIRIRPAVAVAGGAEVGFGVYLNAEDPDAAAGFMRDILGNRES